MRCKQSRLVVLEVRDEVQAVSSRGLRGKG